LPSVYISPTGSGDQSGSSAANAGTLSNLNTMIARAGPGGQVLMLADQGTYTLSADLQIYSGGATVRGVNSAGEAMQATISSPSASIFVLRNGADGLTFKDLFLKDTTGGFGALRIGGDIHGLTVDNVDAGNVRAFLAVGASSGQTASIDGLVVRNTEVTGYTGAAIKIAGDSHNILLEDIRLDGQNKDPSSYMMGVHLIDTTHDVIIRRVTAENNLYTGSKYYNGDGFVAEDHVYNLRIEDSVARNNGDAGFDIKASGTVLENVLAEGNKRNFRFWGDDITAYHVTGRDPHVTLNDAALPGQVWLGEGSHVTISDSSFTDNASNTVVFLLDSNAILSLVNGAVSKAASATLQQVDGGGQINWVTSASPSNPPSTIPPASSLPPVTGSQLVGGDIADYLQGLASNDELHGGGGDDYLRGGDGNDRIYGDAGFDDANGNIGDDTVDGGLGPDWVVGGQGGDFLLGQDDGDVVLGNLGLDTCSGGVGDDVVRGGRDNDSVSGGAGADFISGDRGDDTVSGGEGGDLFNFFSGAGVDRVIDFSVAQGDHVRIEGGAAYSIHASGADTVIDLGNGDQMVLVGVSPTSLPDGWLLIA
jgi:Ca2+-binding RTX toxin-like protein